MKHYFRSIIAASAVMMTLPALASEPVAPSGVTAVSTPAGVVISWQPVTEDIDENEVDPDEVIYDVYRCDAQDQKVLVGEDIVETTFTDVIGEVTGEVYYRWQVIAKTADGSSSSWEGYSSQLSFGDGAALPYVETFNTESGWYVTPDNYWLAENTVGYSDFDVDSELYFDFDGEDVYIHGEDRTPTADDGFLYFEPSGYSSADTSYTSGGINIGTTENPVISYSYYAIPGSHVSYQIRILDAEGTAHEIVNATVSGDALGWKKVENVSLSEFKNQKIRIQIHSAYFPDNAPSTGLRTPVCLDNIKVADGENVGVVDIMAGTAASTEYFTIDGRRVANPAAGQLLIKVERMADGAARTSKVIIR